MPRRQKLGSYYGCDEIFWHKISQYDMGFIAKLYLLGVSM